MRYQDYAADNELTESRDFDTLKRLAVVYPAVMLGLYLTKKISKKS